jgi:nucleoside-diphosphate-sugar epimerase
MPGKIVVAGALGLVGRAVLEHFEGLADWEIVALSRRAPDFPSRAGFVSVDLADAADCRAKLGAVEGATHAVYCALFEKPDLGRGWLESDQIATNRAMLQNFLDGLEPGNPGLRHVALLQGTKAYGIHLGPMNVPARESAPRHPHPNFYWAQEDLLKERQGAAAWSWTIFRPQVVIGFAVGSAMNMLAAVGVYAAIGRELGLPLVFPGVGRTVLQATDARLLARAIAWAGTAPAAANQTFNVTNGDVFTGRNVWPAIARHFGMEVGLDQRMPLAIAMADKGPVWSSIVEKYRLAPYGYDELIGSSWQFADFSLGDRGGATASLMSTIKIRQAGFADCIDTEEMFRWWLGELQRRRVLPP